MVEAKRREMNYKTICKQAKELRLKSVVHINLNSIQIK